MDNPFYIYIIESISDGLRYVGMTQNIEKRLAEHNSGKSKFTSGHMPWRLLYHEFAGDKKLARQLEKYYKTAAGRRKISTLFPKPEK